MIDSKKGKRENVYIENQIYLSLSIFEEEM